MNGKRIIKDNLTIKIPRKYIPRKTTGIITAAIGIETKDQ